LTSINRLKGLLHNPDYHNRIGAVAALGKFPGEQAIQLLMEHLVEFDKADEDSKVNWAAAYTLAGMGDAALMTLSNTLQADANYDKWQRSWIVTTLGLMRDIRAVGVLLETINDEDVRGEVADALSRIGDKRALQPLVDILPDSKQYAAIAVKKAIASLQST
jgi:HEAT repeat protein